MSPDDIKLVEGRSLWQDALRRLIKNRAAMLGAIVTIAIALVVALADWIVPIDPTHQQAWLQGARPPGETHDVILDTLDVQEGQETNYPPARLRISGRREFRINARKFTSLDVRAIVKKKTGLISSIKVTSGIEVPTRVDEVMVAGEFEHLISADPEVREKHEFADLTLRKGQKIPAGMEVLLGKPSRGRSVLWLKRIALAEKPLELTFALEDQTVRDLQLDGEGVASYRLDGRLVNEVYRNDKRFQMTHWLGQDNLGRDVLSRVIMGGRISFLIGIVATLVSLIIGVLYGAISGYVGGWVDGLMMRIVDILYAIPYMFLVILLMVTFGRDVLVLFIALGAVQWLTMARIIRGQVLSLKEKEYIEAAQAAGGSTIWIITRHLIPNVLGIVAVYTTLTIPAVILQESFLAFIGLSVEWQGQAIDSWGALTADGMNSLGRHGENKWLLISPALALAITLFSLNFLGDGLRDAFDPQMKGRT